MAEHRVFPHGELERLADGVWRVRGSLSYPLSRNMIVLRLPTGELLLHSVVALDEPGMKGLEALGSLAFAIVPSTAHMMDIAFYKSRYPELKVLAPAVHGAAIEAKVPLAGHVEDLLPPFGFRLHLVPGTRVPEYFYEWPLRAGGRMLMGNDALGSANMGESGKLMGRLITRLAGTPGNRLGVGKLYRMAIARDVAALKRFAAGLAEIPDLRLVTVSHGEPVTHDPAAALRAAAD